MNSVMQLIMSCLFRQEYSVEMALSKLKGLSQYALAARGSINFMADSAMTQSRSLHAIFRPSPVSCGN